MDLGITPGYLSCMQSGTCAQRKGLNQEKEGLATRAAEFEER